MAMRLGIRLQVTLEDEVGSVPGAVVGGQDAWVAAMIMFENNTQRRTKW